MKKVAVITRTKNRPLMLPRARDSVLSQSFKDFVWVIVNDAGERGYVDETARIAELDDIEVKVIHREQSRGMEAASNQGIKSVDSTYIVVHDDDDTWHPEFLSKMAAFLDQKPGYLGVICYQFKVHEKIANDRIVVCNKVRGNVHLDSVQLADMLEHNSFAPISFLYRRSAFDALEGYDEELPPLADWDFNLRMLLIGDIGLVPEVLANYHIRKSVQSSHMAYGNSIITGYSDHMTIDASYRNRKLREDLTNGVIGLGFLLCQGRQMYQVTRKVNYMERVMRLPQHAWHGFKNIIKKNEKLFSKDS